MSEKVVLITGISGQDGAYLSELLLDKGYEVHGLIRRHSNVEEELGNVKHLEGKVGFHYGDLLDVHSIGGVLYSIKPDFVFNLAAQSHVGISSKMPEFTMAVNSNGVLNLLEQLRLILPNIRFYQASSSEMFGNNKDPDGFQRETTQMGPVSPYACAKLCAFNLVQHYRSAYGMFACNGILFNHESPRRGVNFVTQKIVRGAVAIKSGQAKELRLGNLDSSRDWGHAYDYVRAMLLMLEHDVPDDYVISTGETHSVREFCEIVFSKLGLNWAEYVEVDPQFTRPQELHYLKGDSTKARTVLGWKPEHTFESLVEDMVVSASNRELFNVFKESNS
jgi:GDPmannose 4,6-dehydratase